MQTVELLNLWCPYIIYTCTSFTTLTFPLNSHNRFLTLKIFSVHCRCSVFRLPVSCSDLPGWGKGGVYRDVFKHSSVPRTGRQGVPMADSWPFVTCSAAASWGNRSQRLDGSRLLDSSTGADRRAPRARLQDWRCCRVQPQCKATRPYSSSLKKDLACLKIPVKELLQILWTTLLKILAYPLLIVNSANLWEPVVTKQFLQFLYRNLKSTISLKPGHRRELHSFSPG